MGEVVVGHAKKQRRERNERLKIMFTNAQSIGNKVDELRALASLLNPDIIALTETWANELAGNELFIIDGYDLIVRKDRNDTDMGRGGGIFIYASKKIHVWSLELNSTFNQCASVRVKCDRENVNIHVIYRSPNSSRDNNGELNKWISEMRGTNVLIGDFNYPEIDWENGLSGARSREFFETVTEKHMYQHVKEPTHASGNVLDLILSDKDEIIQNVHLNGKLGKSDHEIIVFEICVDATRLSEQRPTWNYGRGDYRKMRESLQKEKWEERLEGKDVDEMWKEISGTLKSLMNEHIPMRRPRKKIEPEWMNRDIKRQIKEKREAWRKWKNSKMESDKKAYKKLEMATKKTIRNSKNKIEREVMKVSKSNPKRFYQFINRSKSNRCQIGPLINAESEIIIEPKQQAQVMNKYFASVFTKADNEMPEATEKNFQSTLTDLEITAEKVEAAIDKLKEHSAAGPDGIAPRVVKETKKELITPLTILFRKSIESGKIPDEWREAVVTPIFKKGKKSDPGNYRPVSLTNVIGKTMERIVKEELMRHVESEKILTNAQHGFRKGRSPQTNLIEFFDTATKWLDEGRSFDVLYLDFQKAFDKVCHARLVKKLKAAGIGGAVLEWLTDWLRGRKQCVRINGEYSDWEDVISSVVQGSVLGGTLFDIFIDDLERVVIDMLIRMFADDTKVAKIVENDRDGEEMQKAIDALADWAKKWAMDFNEKKCKVIHFGNKNPMIEYHMNGTKIETSKEEKDLGVWISSSMKPAKQCAAAANSANFALGQIMRAFHYRKKSHLVPLYKTFVRPKLEFAAASWNPWQEGDIKTLEKIQERFVKQLSDVRGTTYEEKAKDAGIPTLKERRSRGDAIEAFKVLNGFSKVEKSEWFEEVGDDARPTRANSVITHQGQVKKEKILKVSNARLEIRKNFFSIRATRTWNDLPERVKTQTSINAFKNAYDAWENSSRDDVQQ